MTDTLAVNITSFNPFSYLVFFDGGSRGNPGPGGAGALVVQLGGSVSSVTVLWVASMSYATQTTTNNLAEYRGLLTGLRACVAAQWSPVHVIGDSRLILGQLRSRKPPRKRHLADIYAQCRMLADQLDIRSWEHHYRAFNKSADYLANLAMDSKRSTQQNLLGIALTPPTLATALTHVASDVRHWLDNRVTEGSKDPVVRAV